MNPVRFRTGQGHAVSGPFERRAQGGRAPRAWLVLSAITDDAAGTSADLQDTAACGMAGNPAPPAKGAQRMQWKHLTRGYGNDLFEEILASLMEQPSVLRE
jgi:hypothetical protein